MNQGPHPSIRPPDHSAGPAAKPGPDPDPRHPGPTVDEVPRRSDRKGSDTLVWMALAATVLVLVGGVILARRFGRDPSVFASPLVGRPVPNVEIPYLDAPGGLNLAALDGQVIVVNFWASWCLSCRLEHQALLDGAAGYEGFGVTFVGVNYQDTTRDALDFLDELGWSPETKYLQDQRSRAALEFGVLGLPETFFVDRDGIIVGKVSGPLSTRLLAQTLDKILLGQTVDSVKTGDVQNRNTG